MATPNYSHSEHVLQLSSQPVLVFSASRHMLMEASHLAASLIPSPRCNAGTSFVCPVPTCTREDSHCALTSHLLADHFNLIKALASVIERLRKACNEQQQCVLSSRHVTLKSWKTHLEEHHLHQMWSLTLYLETMSGFKGKGDSNLLGSDTRMESSAWSLSKAPSATAIARTTAAATAVLKAIGQIRCGPSSRQVPLLHQGSMRLPCPHKCGHILEGISIPAHVLEDHLDVLLSWLEDNRHRSSPSHDAWALIGLPYCGDPSVDERVVSMAAHRGTGAIESPSKGLMHLNLQHKQMMGSADSNSSIGKLWQHPRSQQMVRGSSSPSQRRTSGLPSWTERRSFLATSYGSFPSKANNRPKASAPVSSSLDSSPLSPNPHQNSSVMYTPSSYREEVKTSTNDISQRGARPLYGAESPQNLMSRGEGKNWIAQGNVKNGLVDRDSGISPPVHQPSPESLSPSAMVTPYALGMAVTTRQAGVDFSLARPGSWPAGVAAMSSELARMGHTMREVRRGLAELSHHQNNRQGETAVQMGLWQVHQQVLDVAAALQSLVGPVKNGEAQASKQQQQLFTGKRDKNDDPVLSSSPLVEEGTFARSSCPPQGQGDTVMEVTLSGPPSDINSPAFPTAVIGAQLFEFLSPSKLLGDAGRHVDRKSSSNSSGIDLHGVSQELRPGTSVQILKTQVSNAGTSPRYLSPNDSSNSSSSGHEQIRSQQGQHMDPNPSDGDSHHSESRVTSPSKLSGLTHIHELLSGSDTYDEAIALFQRALKGLGTVVQASRQASPVKSMPNLNQHDDLADFMKSLKDQPQSSSGSSSSGMSQYAAGAQAGIHALDTTPTLSSVSNDLSGPKPEVFGEHSSYSQKSEDGIGTFSSTPLLETSRAAISPLPEILGSLITGEDEEVRRYEEGVEGKYYESCGPSSTCSSPIISKGDSSSNSLPVAFMASHSPAPRDPTPFESGDNVQFGGTLGGDGSVIFGMPLALPDLATHPVPFTEKFSSDILPTQDLYGGLMGNASSSSNESRSSKGGSRSDDEEIEIREQVSAPTVNFDHGFQGQVEVMGFDSQDSSGQGQAEVLTFDSQGSSGDFREHSWLHPRADYHGHDADCVGHEGAVTSQKIFAVNQSEAAGKRTRPDKNSLSKSFESRTDVDEMEAAGNLKVANVLKQELSSSESQSEKEVPWVHDQILSIPNAMSPQPQSGQPIVASPRIRDSLSISGSEPDVATLYREALEGREPCAADRAKVWDPSLKQEEEEEEEEDIDDLIFGEMNPGQNSIKSQQQKQQAFRDAESRSAYTQGGKDNYEVSNVIAVDHSEGDQGIEATDGQQQKHPLVLVRNITTEDDDNDIDDLDIDDVFELLEESEPLAIGKGAPLSLPQGTLQNNVPLKAGINNRDTKSGEKEAPHLVSAPQHLLHALKDDDLEDLDYDDIIELLDEKPSAGISLGREVVSRNVVQEEGEEEDFWTSVNTATNRASGVPARPVTRGKGRVAQKLDDDQADDDELLREMLSEL